MKPFFGYLEIPLCPADGPLFQPFAEIGPANGFNVVLDCFCDQAAPISFFDNPIHEPDGRFGQRNI